MQKAIWIAWMLFVGVYAFTKFRSGQFRIGRLGGPPDVVDRRIHPRKFWGFVVFFYVVLALIVGIVLAGN